MAPAMAAPTAPAASAPVAPAPEKTADPMKDDKKKGVDGTSYLPAQASVVVELPTDARLYADGQLTHLTSGTRSFLTPELELGKSYHYTFKVEFTRDGKVVSETKRAVVTAGTETRVRFDEAEMVATQTARK
jgi:uncharacterized protein (TIGR03000 family)